MWSGKPPGRRQDRENTFPVTVGPGLMYYGDGDSFVARLAYRTLEANAHTISAGTGGGVAFTLDAGQDHANRSYLLLAGVSGIVPGHPLPGGLTTLLINLDWLSDLIFLLANTPMLHNFKSTLNASGGAAAQLDAPMLPASTIGLVMDFASNAVAVEIVP